jgi:hypothetical protein
MNNNEENLLWKIEYIELTDEPIREIEEEHGLTPELIDNLARYLKRAMNGNTADIPFFDDLIKKHPQSPELKNYLMVLHTNADNTKEAFELNRKIQEEHPNYLYAKVNYAEELMDNNRLDAVPVISPPFA